MLETPRLYDVDRLDVTVSSTLDADMQDAVTAMLRKLQDRAYVKSANLAEARLLGSADPGAVLYTFTLYERGKDANYVRVQTDNSSQPFDTNEGAKLELGSTAKLRTLATYLDLIATLHEKYEPLSTKELRAVEVDPRDHLTRWTIDLPRHFEGPQPEGGARGGDGAALFGESRRNILHRRGRAYVLELQARRRRQEPDGARSAARVGQPRVHTHHARRRLPLHVPRRRTTRAVCCRTRAIPSAAPTSRASPTTKAAFSSVTSTGSTTA